KRVTFTGGEITLEKKLFQYLDYARTHGGFDHIRLQTNGRLLANRDYAKRLVDGGVDEFFVSLHGPDPETQDTISQREGSFDEAWQGLQNLKDLGVVIMTNTVLTTLNVDTLTQIVERVHPLEPARMEFWNYLPMEDYADERQLLVPMHRLGPAMRSALGRAKELGIRCAVKYVPRCLLGEHGDCIDNTQPDVVIVEEFYDVYPKFACLWEAKCEHAEACLGLTHPYISKFGWEEERLVPTPRTTPWREPQQGLALGSDDPHGDELAPSHHPEWLALVEGVATPPARLEALLLDRRRATFRFAVDGGRVDLVLTRRSDERPALLRTQSFNISYRSLEMENESVRAQLIALIERAARSVRARDQGEMLLDERKGLVGPEAKRRPRRAKA
ncbi:MAG: radical SAM protein, partial [Myxococcota bacterium]